MIVRTYREGDEKQIIEVIKSAFSSMNHIGEKYWSWLFKNNPLGTKYVWVAENGGRLIGHYSVIPSAIKIDGKKSVVVRTTLTAIHADYQGLGVFPRLIKQAQEELARGGVSFNYVIPNKRASPIYKNKLNWVQIPLQRTLVKQFISRGILRNCRFPSFEFKWPDRFDGKKDQNSETSSFNIYKLYRFNENYQHFCDEACKNYKIITIRDENYLSWRYLDSPGQEYVIYAAEKDACFLGYIVLKSRKISNMGLKGLKEGIIVDLLALPDQERAVEALIAKAMEHFEDENVTIVSTFVQYKHYYDIFRKNGFIPLPFATIQLYVQIYSNDVSENELSDRDCWFITTGDLIT